MLLLYTKRKGFARRFLKTWLITADERNRAASRNGKAALLSYA